MTPQEAYKTLDLAKGLGMDRIEAQFTKLKTEMETKGDTSKIWGEL